MQMANTWQMAPPFFFDLPPQPGDTKLDQTIFEGEFMFISLTRYFGDT